MIDERALQRVVSAAELAPGDTVLEIGAGLGQLTEELGRKSKLVVALEKDRTLGEFLRKKFKNWRNVKIVINDALLFDPATMARWYTLVGNLPYQITSPVLRKFLEHENRPNLIVVMVQKEVGERLTAKPGSRDRGVLTVAAEFFGKASVVATVPKPSFWPQPEVDSAIVRIETRDRRYAIDNKRFFSIVKAGFSAKRQKLQNALSRALRVPKDDVREWLHRTRISPDLRAEDLSLDQWVTLTEKK